MKTYAFVGASSRGIGMYAVPVASRFSDVARIVGVYDPNHKRAELLRSKAGGAFPTYDGFEEMIIRAKPDVVIVTTMDRYHHEYIIKALEAGCDVITEKPMTVDEDKVNSILEAEARTGKAVTVTFNMRFMPFFARMKDMIREGTLGRIFSVHFEWFLDTKHGADYFRRWHRRKENSGGLLVHKSTHHFDVVNWLLREEPEEVSAFGNRRFYGPTREERGERCLTCGYKNKCEFYMDITSGGLKELYLDCEDIDGYYRDRCVFSEDIDIEDSMSVSVKYSGGALMSYSLTAHSPYEGFRLVLNGSVGRLEAEYFHGSVGPYAGEQVNRLRLYNRNQEEITIKTPVVGGTHSGGDERLLDMLIRGGFDDPLGQQASSWDGAMSNMVGIAANKSIKDGKTYRIKELIRRPLSAQLQ